MYLIINTVGRAEERYERSEYRSGSLLRTRQPARHRRATQTAPRKGRREKNRLLKLYQLHELHPLFRVWPLWYDWYCSYLANLRQKLPYLFQII